MKRLDFLSIVLALIGVNFCIFDPLFIPREDAKIKLEVFYFFYNTVTQNSVWPLWMPLHTFGVPSVIWQWIGLTPVHYAGILIGKIFHISDVLLLFKMCHLSNELFFVTGLYVLSRVLWPQRYIAWLLCMGCGLFHWWYIDLDLKFHVFYFLPWALWLLVTFFESGQGWRLYLVPVVLIVWAMGNCLYYISLWGWLLTIFTAVVWRAKRGTFRPDFSGLSAMLTLTLMVVVIAAFGWQFHDYLSQMTDLQRLEGAGKNSIADFMTYGPVYQGSWENIAHYFFLGDTKDYYLPTALVVFAVWALCFVRQPVALGLMVTTGALVLFSFKGWFTYLSYFLPGMSLFHDAGNVYGLAKVFITLLAGYGIQDFFHTHVSRRWVRLGWIVLGTIAAIDGLGLTRQYVTASFAQNLDPLKELPKHEWGWRLIGLTAVGFMAIAMARLKRLQTIPDTWPRVVLALWVILDLGAFSRGFMPDMSKFHWPSEFKRLWDTTPQPYTPIRSPQPLNERDRQLWALFNKDTMYACLFSVTNFDPCWPQARVDFVTKRLALLANVRVPPQITGCLQPKLHFFANATTVAGLKEALSIVNTRGLDGQKPVIETGRNQFPPTDPDAGLDYATNVVAFNPNQLKISFNAPGIGWLVYSDNWYTGWRAWVNGQPATVYPSDIAFKAVRVSHTGKTVVEWKFMPWPDGTICLGWVLLGTTVALTMFGVLTYTLITSLIFI